MSRFASGRAAVALACVIGAAGIAGSAQAGGAVDSKVTLRVNQATAKFKGKVTSPADDCVVGRKVLIYRKEPGRDTKVTKTFASESGRYAATIPMQDGNKLYSRIKRYRTPLDTVCRADRSRTVTG